MIIRNLTERQVVVHAINFIAFNSISTPRPIAVEALEQKDEEDGNPEKFINKTPDFLK